MKFNYQARNKIGEIQSGVIEASSRETAATILQKYGLYVTILEETEKAPLLSRRIKIFEGVSRAELVIFSRQLAIMFGAKVTLVEALKTMSTQIKNADFREKILKISENIESGSSFSAAISKYPQFFSSFYVAMVRSGEASGKLAEAISYLAEHLEREYHMMSRVKGAMIYPALIFIVVLGIVALMIFFVVPQLTQILLESDQELPFITQVAMIFADFLRKWGLVFALALMGLIFAVFKYYKTEKGKDFFDKIFLKIPLIGGFFKLVYLSRFAENLSTLISGGLPISQCLEITAKIVGNSVYRKIIFETGQEVRKGEPISSVLVRYPDAFSPVFTQMTLVGEKSGTLDRTLMTLVGFYQKETERKAENMISILEPLMILFLGLIVGGLIGAFLLPLYQITGI